MREAAPEQFEILSDVEVRHAPTGALFAAQRYESPTRANVLSVLWVYRGTADEVRPDGGFYVYEQILRVAGELLVAQAVAQEEVSLRACA